jgi:hypothetical protein
MNARIAAHRNNDPANRRHPSRVRPSPPAPAPVTLSPEVTNRRSSRGASSVLDVVGKGGGDALGTGLQAEAETRLGSDFSRVRIHTDAKAAESAAAVAAKAYTVGDEIVFGRGSFAPNHSEGKRRLVHELVHVQQQRERRVAATDLHRGVAVSDPSDPYEREAEAKASEVMAVSAPTAVGGVTPSRGELAGPLSQRAESSSRATVQRDAEAEKATGEFQKAAKGEPSHTAAWRAFFQAALQGVQAGSDPKVKAETAKTIADFAERRAIFRNEVLEKLRPTLSEQDFTLLQQVFRGNSFWFMSFSSALQGAAGLYDVKKGMGPGVVVDNAEQTADQAELVSGDVPQELWQKYMDALKPFAIKRQ